jgi:hypothetical protein
MPALSTTCSNNFLDKEFGADDFTPPASHFAALYSMAPAADGSGGTELSFVDGYERLEIVNDGTSWTAASAKVKTNAILLAFAQADADWDTAVAIVLLDASTAGNVRAHGQLDEPVTVRSGKNAEFAIGALEIVFA